MDAISSAVIAKALDGLSMRAAATAQNVAGAGSRGYRTMRVDFESSLKAAAAKGVDAVQAVALNFTTAPLAPGDEPRLDLELETASETSLRYGALLDMLGRQTAIMRTAVRGGQ